MPHFPKPFYRVPLKRWYVQFGTKQYPLGDDPTPRRNKKGERIAPQHVLDKFEELRTARKQGRVEPQTVASDLAVTVIGEFLDWVQQNRAPRCYEWYQRHCQAFTDAIPRELKAASVKPEHVTKACNAAWSVNTRYGFMRAIQRAFNWARKQGKFPVSPLADLEKPEPQERDVFLNTAEYEKVLTLLRGTFRDLIIMAWESGARPQELRLMEARHVDWANARVVLPPKEAKGKKHPRVVYLNAVTLPLVRSLADRNSDGPIFRNSKGLPWTRWSINCAFSRLQQKFGRRLHLGAFRKSWATQALKNGVDVVTAAHLLGHKDTAVLSRVYAKMQHDPAYMREQANKATGASVPPTTNEGV